MTSPRLRTAFVALAACVASVTGCSRAPSPPVTNAPNAAPAPALDVSSAPQRPKMVMLGDSLTEGLGLFTTQAYPELLQAKFDADGVDIEVVNAGLSGDTTAGALRRLDWALSPDTRILFIALGGNDALRGLSTKDTEDNLTQMIETAQGDGVTVVLAGMEGPTNLGADYRAAFHNIFVNLAAQYQLTFVPFLLDGVAGDPALNQTDGIHPNAAGAKVMADRLYPVLKKVVEEVGG